MISKIPMKLYFLFSIIITFVLNSIYALNINYDNDEKNGDQYYLILVENDVKGDIKNGFEKRELKEQLLDSVVSEINNLIIGNMDTYNDPSKLEKIGQATSPSPFRKRNEEHKFAYTISSLDDESLVYSYLSKQLVPLVHDIPNVKIIVPDIKMKENSGSNDNLKRLRNYNDWKNPCVKGNTYNYLSLISQDRYDDSAINASYDNNYYYPGSAGEGINIFVIDSGFNFRHFEYSNNDRIAQCLISISEDSIYEEFNDFCSYEYDNNHGNKVANIVGGLTNGVASRANIYGIVTYRDEVAYTSTFIKALEYINQNYLNLENPINIEKFIHKTVINISSAVYLDEYNKLTEGEERDLLSYLYNLIEEMTNKGSIFVVSAGNDSVSVDNFTYPCTFNNVICVGSTDNLGINEYFYEMDVVVKNENNTLLYPNHNEWMKLKNVVTERYKIINEELMESRNMMSMNYRTAVFSNYGKMVDIYAPGFIKYFFQDRYGNSITGYTHGTSFSAPIVSGVIATIMSEFPNQIFDTQSMLQYLYEIGLKNVIQGIPKGYPNVFINNGKHLNYAHSNEYMNCGHSADTPLCSKNSELECFYHGCCLKNNVV